MAIYVPKMAQDAFRKEIIASVLCGVMVGGLYPFLGFIASHRLHASATLISLIFVANPAGSFLSPLWTNLAEGKRKLSWVCNTWIIARAAFFLMIFANTSWQFAAIAIASQFVASLPIPGYAYIMKIIYPSNHRGRLMGYIRTAMWLTASASTLALGPVLKAHGESYKIVFPLAALFGVISVLIFRRIEVPGDVHVGRSDDAPTLLQSFKESWSVLDQDRRFGWFILTTSIYGFGNFMLFAVIPKYQDEILRMHEGNLAIYTTVINVVTMASFLYWGQYTDRRSPVRVTALTLLFNSTLPVIYFLAPSYLWILPGAVITGIITGGLELGYLNAVLNFAPAGREMQYQGVQAVAVGLRGMAGPLTGGILYDTFSRSGADVRLVFVVSFVLIFVGWAMLVLGIKRRFRRPKPSG